MTAGAPKHKIKILSYNIHKGFSGGIPKFTLKSMRDEIRRLEPDLLFLQEVHGEHHGHRKKHEDFPSGSQFEYLAEEMWPHFRYGKNAVYTEGHHGNAILSKFPVSACENIDISQNRFEKRGLLHATLEVPGKSGGSVRPLHALCAHLGLFEWDRRVQLSRLADRIRTHIPKGEPVIAAGDFNDWRKRASSPLEKKLGLKEAFMDLHGSHARTFPSWLPVLCLDRIYLSGRGLHLRSARPLNDPRWVALSDHLALWVELDY